MAHTDMQIFSGGIYLQFVCFCRKFWLVEAPKSTEETGHPKLGSIRDKSYNLAIETLQQIRQVLNLPIAIFTITFLYICPNGS